MSRPPPIKEDFRPTGHASGGDPQRMTSSPFIAAKAPYFQNSHSLMGWLSRCLSLGSPTREEGGTAMEDSKCRNASPSAVMSAECLVKTVGLSSSGSVTSEATRGRSQRMVVTVPRLRAVRWASGEGARPDAGNSWVLRQDGRGKMTRGRQSRRNRGNGRETSKLRQCTVTPI